MLELWGVLIICEKIDHFITASHCILLLFSELIPNHFHPNNLPFLPLYTGTLEWSQTGCHQHDTSLQPTYNVMEPGTSLTWPPLINMQLTDRWTDRLTRLIHTLKPVDNIFICILLNKNYFISVAIALNSGPNYLNDVCCVVTVCHQVSCMYWGHLGHCHRAISHFKCMVRQIGL